MLANLLSEGLANLSNGYVTRLANLSNGYVVRYFLHMLQTILEGVANVFALMHL